MLILDGKLAILNHAPTARMQILYYMHICIPHIYMQNRRTTWMELRVKLLSLPWRTLR